MTDDQPSGDADAGKELLQQMMPFLNLEGSNFGFPMKRDVPADNREEWGKMQDDIQALLDANNFTKGTDYEWSYPDQGNRAALNLKKPAYKKLERLVNEQSVSR